MRQYRPDLIPCYEELYERGAYLPKEERRRLASIGGRRRPGALAGSTRTATLRGRQ